MKNRLLVQLFLFLLLFLTWCDIHKLQSRPAIGKVSGPLPVFPGIQMELLKSPNPALVHDALKETVKSLLRYIAPDLSQEPWHAQYLFLNLLGKADPEIVTALSLAPDRGIIAILQKQNGHYILLYYLDNLLPIARLDKLSVLKDRDILLTREDYQERLGAYSEYSFLKLWGWPKDSLQVLWEDCSFSEVNWLNTWQEPPSSRKKWLKLTHGTTVSYHASPLPHIRINSRQTLSEAPTANETLPDPLSFQTKKSRELTQEYHWSEEWQKFILSSGTATLPGSNQTQRIAVLKDLETHPDALVLDEPGKYQVINTKGNIFTVEKKHVKLDS